MIRFISPEIENKMGRRMPDIDSYLLATLSNSHVYYAENKVKNKLVEFIRSWEKEEYFKDKVINTVYQMDTNYKELAKVISARNLVVMKTNKKLMRLIDLKIELYYWRRLLITIHETLTSPFPPDGPDKFYFYVIGYLAQKQNETHQKIKKIENKKKGKFAYERK